MEDFAPIRRGIAEAAGVKTHYYEAGVGNRCTLLLHGMSASADTFRELMLELARQYHVVAPDIPGFGDTADTEPFTFPHLADWLGALLAALDVTPVNLVGHSFGGALAVSYALNAPSEVSSLALLAPSVLRPGKYPEWLRSFARSSLAERVLSLGVSASRLMLQRQMRAAFYDPSRFGPDMWQRHERDYKRARASAGVLRASAMHDMRSDLHAIAQRSCIIWGCEDPILDPADAQRLIELMPASSTELHMLSQCGHLPHIEQREQVIEILSGFLAAPAV